MPTTSTSTTTTATSTATTTVDMATVANGHSELQTNATPTENLIVGVNEHVTNAQPRPPNPLDAPVPTLPHPPRADKPHHNINVATNAMLPATTGSHRTSSPTPVTNSPRAPRGVSPVANNQSEDLMSFESVSSQLIAAANHNPYPTHKPYPNNMLANEIPPLSAANQSHVHSSVQASLLHSRVNTNAAVATTTTVNSNPQTTEGDLIVLDTLKATEITKMKQESANKPIGPFEQDMIIVGKDDSSTDKSYPHHRGVTGTNSGAVVTGMTTNQLAPAHSSTHTSQSFPQQRHTNTHHKSSNQIQASQLSYRDGFGVSQSDVLCVEAMQMWVKAEMSLAKGDMVVGLLAYKKVSGEHY